VASPRTLTAPHLRLASAEGGVFLYENTRALPRVFVPEEVAAAATAEEAMATAARWLADPARRAVVETQHAPLAAGGRGVATSLRPTPERIEIEARLEQPGFVVVSEAFDPGWRATVDGAAAPVYPCDLALMAIPLPAGQHRTSLEFRPRWWRLAVALSLTGLLAAGVLALVTRRRGGERRCEPMVVS
jgi:hypothetical protein